VETGQIINVNGAGVVFSQEAATGLAFVDSSVTPNRVVVRQVQSCADIGSRNTSVTR
jgi:hypothetical protein